VTVIARLVWLAGVSCFASRRFAVSFVGKGGEMIRTRNRYQVEVCGAVRAAGRCPSLCQSEGGCFCTDYPKPGVVLNVAEMKRRCHRSRRVMAKLNILNQGGGL